MTFSEHLQAYRKEAGLSQEELAGRLGVSRQSVSKWEQGQAFPETDKLIELSDMMRLSLDSLLREGDTTPPPLTGTSAPSRRWHLAAILLAVAAVALAFAVVKLLTQAPEAPKEPQTYPVELPAPPEEPEPDPEPEPKLPAQKAILTGDLPLLREWFFDFGRQYRLDYMPVFTQEEGPSEDAAEYLYWAYAINLGNWGDNVGTMTRTYVEETVQRYFGPEPGIIPGMHRTLRKSWSYDEQTETYTAWPESLRDQPYFLLDSITIEGDVYTVRATEYDIPMGYPSEEEDAAFRQALLEGTPGEMTPRNTVTIRFYLSYFYFDQPRFLAFQQEWVPSG